MKYPKLVPDRICQTDITVVIYGEGVSETGSPIIVSNEELKCNYQDNAYTKLTAEQKIVTLSGKAYFNGDICPRQAIISGGYVEVHGVKRTIYKGTKSRNPNGTVNFTVLELN